MDGGGSTGTAVQVLGRIQVLVNGAEVELGPSGPRSVFAVLALRANTTVTLDELIAALWGDTPPRTAEGGIYSHVSTLRKALEPGRGRKDEPRVLTSSRAGYSLVLPPEAVDAFRFETEASEARRRWAANDFDAALIHCDRALREWGGPPLGGAAGPFAEAERARLELLELDLLELRCAALLETGAAGAAAAALTTLTAEHPLRERLHELLMLALGRSGRQAEAIGVYQRLRARLIDELGVEPGPATRRVHEQLLAGDDTTPIEPGPRVVPAQLPHGVSEFTGREAELRRLGELCAEAAGATHGGSVVISAIDGGAGVGKTALAVHLAYRVVKQFPDGQLFLDLRGFDPHLAPVTPEDALGHLLRGLGAKSDGQYTGIAAQSALYRSLLAGRRVLVVLDNAVSAEQVRPLLPASPGCLALVTSRNRLAGLVALDGASRLSLDVLQPSESLALLSRILATARVEADLADVRALAELCGHLPLALRIAAERVLSLDHHDVAHLVEELRTERDRLDALSTLDDESSVIRTVFSWSYQSLKPVEAQAFRRLGLHPSVEFDVAEAAALLDASAPETRRLLAGLAQSHLLEPVARDRYRFHDLLRIYAAECAERDESPVAVKQAVRRLLRWCLASAVAARELLTPELGPIETEPPNHPPFAPTGYEDALAWTNRELPTLIDALRLAVDHGLDAYAAKIATALGGLCHCTSRWPEWLRVTEIGLAAAWRAGDRLCEARLYNDSGVVHHFLGHGDQAVSYHRKAVDLLTELAESGEGNQEAIAANLAVAYLMMGMRLDAMPLLMDALAIAHRQENLFVESAVSEALSAVLSRRGRHDEAIEHGLRCVELARQTGSEHMLAYGMAQVGGSCLRAGRVEEAVRHFDDALQLWRSLGDRWGEVHSMHALARALRKAGDLDRARELLTEALDIVRGSERPGVYDREVAEIRALLAVMS
ncbi:BTAD domain-containing putative transcriptional regulator [Kutzneria sp. NPDC052558]|uniref:AfsR/SARP family transcriptional regulator n=1 Tax=Kutzneria sp. NPDC052558 TaxID=3364121 RepID=UPI0037CBB7FA